ncbi:MAG: DUF819 family protein [Marinilabiliaceae bacterium]|jgi:uncharacterized membrane protein|nr:DUF819 family protein [Marinilabiliaceae bacterium]
MVKIVILILFYLFFPLVIIWLCKKWSLFARLGSIVIAYAFGLILGNTGILSLGSSDYLILKEGRNYIPSAEIELLYEQGKISDDDLFSNRIATTQDLITTIVIPLALPLLLFSLNIRRWLKYAGVGFLSMTLALISVVIIVFASYFIFRDKIPDSGKVAGMLIGIYTGGTPNVAAIKTALGVDSNLFIMTHTSDLVIGAITIIFFITLGPKVFSLFLPKFRFKVNGGSNDALIEEAKSMEDYSLILKGERPLLNILASVGLTILIFGISGGVAMLFPSSFLMMIVILGITTLGIGASLIPRVNRLKGTFQMGMYLILIFSLVVASMADLTKMLSAEYLNVTMMVAFVVFGSLILHLILAAIFKVNVDDFLITTTALVYSPPFVPVVAGALKNKEIIITGLTVGIIGYAIGNYIGIFIGQILG